MSKLTGSRKSKREKENRHLEFQIVLSRDTCQPMVGPVSDDLGQESTRANQERVASVTFPDCMSGKDDQGDYSLVRN